MTLNNSDTITGILLDNRNFHYFGTTCAFPILIYVHLLISRANTHCCRRRLNNNICRSMVLVSAFGPKECNQSTYRDLMICVAHMLRSSQNYSW